MSTSMNEAHLSPEERGVFQIIQRALVSMAPKKLSFKYTSESGETSDREVEPYELKPNGSLFAHDLGRDATRQFKIGRMSQVRLGETFVPRHPISIPL